MEEKIAPIDANMVCVTPERADALLAEVGLPGTARRYPHELSGGMRQRAALVRMLMTGPDILLTPLSLSPEPCSTMTATTT
ncbi:MAG: Hydroxymethylpyrimidine ABC transporter, ATPase component [Candidatus Carbobacillus altaicus]|uniref:Hydroxymethylpyrimidine ABC transporter, ATPase component n=1 Tax=Candidatus Carbonibacillus altaicus TaxID=2163959 RepID=A0A2R6Y3V2_9BACL|nr:MAG: Hydroxymethylpyrimidine ABC transporter, ATPase component [Candidatus Carbobacillus altaicus]